MMDTGTGIEYSFKNLAKDLKGELFDDPLNLGIYSTDASNYQITPLAVVLPKDEYDLKTVVNWASKHNIPIMARGGGTSLVGQTVAKAIVIDFTKYMDRVLELNVLEKWAWVEPGIVRDVLNQKFAEHQLHFAPDPATTSRATVGGMIANNSSGTRSILYGKTLDHVIELKVLLADGTMLHCKNLNEIELKSKQKGSDRESEIYKNVYELIQRNKTEIETRFPKVMRRVGGYNLDEFISEDWNLARIFVGSECTLGLILAAKINLEPTPKYQCLCIVHFEDFFDAISHIAEMVSFKPAAVELLDAMLIEKSRENIETKHYCDFIQGHPEGVQVVEFYGETAAEAQSKAEKMAAALQLKNIGYAWPIISDQQEMEAVFTVRKKGLGLLMGVKGNRKPIAFIEDAAVPLEHLANYIRQVFAICKSHKVPVVAYAHASVGLLHVKPLLDLREPEDIESMKKISEETLDLVKLYKGSWSGEHGDGLARSPYNLSFFGSKLYQAFKEIKKIFDPDNIMNPGKIVDAPAVDSNLRYGAHYKDEAFQSMFKYRTEGSFAEAVHLCNGVGECRKMNGGTMCPSFRATRDEKDTTRARANLLRLAMSGQLDDKGLGSPLLAEVMDLCLSCKACKSECPSNVDMAKLKSEVNYLHKKNKTLSAADFLIKNQELLGKINSGAPSKIINALLKSKVIRYLIEKTTGLDRRRILPAYASHQFKNYSKEKIEDIDVVLFADSYIKFHEPGIGISAKKLLENLGLRVRVYSKSCCQRPALSHGLLDVAKSEGLKTFLQLEKYLKNKIPVLVCEPSCASALKDDIPDLLEDGIWSEYAESIFLIEDYLASNERFLKAIPVSAGNYLMHGHCHQKALFTTASVHKIFSNHKDVHIQEINSGCCGMAGSFGYKKEHYELSEKIARQVLIPAIDSTDANTQIIANGFSCRHQIADFGNRKAKHWLAYLDIKDV